MPDVDDVLAHFGVKGMRWGVSKNDTTKVGRSTITSKNTKIKEVNLANQVKKQTAPSKDASSAAISKKKISEKSLDALSNDELKRLVNRMNLEKQYKDLKNGDLTSGQKFVKELIERNKKDLSTSVSTEFSKRLQSTLSKK
jgi:hypothetical protein